ncbi:hypothetical protein Y032_0010g883 [Ancylostoma ceylanicum]|uniref:Uncharacterized protein n=1 Tax=Ancylostoma ceylanicum TaxID=53326 RepID=A0A016VH85_9BILA|nr:hypothetical protein Y032_0010g883 [Ancylostoma ceylanicum]
MHGAVASVSFIGKEVEGSHLVFCIFSFTAVFRQNKVLSTAKSSSSLTIRFYRILRGFSAIFSSLNFCSTSRSICLWFLPQEKRNVGLHGHIW